MPTGGFFVYADCSRVRRRQRRVSAATCWKARAWRSRRAWISAPSRRAARALRVYDRSGASSRTASAPARVFCAVTHADARIVRPMRSNAHVAGSPCAGVLRACRLQRHRDRRLLLAGRVRPARPHRARATDPGSDRQSDRRRARPSACERVQRNPRLREPRARTARQRQLHAATPISAGRSSCGTSSRRRRFRSRRAQWCFPVAGCVNYRGYFRENEARAEAARLRAAGDDVYVGGVPAYSTLGWFDDPVLSSFVRWPDTEVARLVFHELAHQVRVRQGRLGLQRVVRRRGGGSGASHAGLRAARQSRSSMRNRRCARTQLRAVFRDLVRDDARDALTRIYASAASGRRQATRQGGSASRR